MDIFKIINSYSRKEALADGILIDITGMAKQTGFIFPVAITREAMRIITDIPAEIGYQDKNGRLFDMLFMANLFARNWIGDRGEFSVILPHWNNNKIVDKAIFKMIIGPGDNLEPVITIMLPNED